MAGTPGSRALVLGGGGITGIGWEVGVLAGLLDEGIDLRSADAVIGTSAGSFVGADYAAGTDWETVFDRQAHAAEHEPVVRTDPAVFAAWEDAFRNGRGDFRAIGAAFGAVAHDHPSPVEPAVRASAVRARLVTDSWAPALRVTITDAETGELVVLGPESGVSVASATAASGAVPGIWPSVLIDGREYVDAGMVSPANASLAAGYDVVLVLAPMPGGYGGIPSAQDDVTRLAASAVAVLETPDDASRLAIGSNPYNASRAGATAAAGRRQGRGLATRLRPLW